MSRFIRRYMAIENNPQWLKKSIAIFSGLVGITILVQGIVIALHPNDVELGIMVIVLGLLFSFGAWRLWPLSKPDDTHLSTRQKHAPPAKDRFQPLLVGMSIVMTIIWAQMFTTGDDDLFWLWVIISPIYLISLGHNFSLHGGMIRKTIPLAISYASACIIWLFFMEIHGDPWGWSDSKFSTLMILSILPPLIIFAWNEEFTKDSEIRPLHRIGIISSLPFCVTGYFGLIFLIPTIVILSLVRLFFYYRQKKTFEPISE